MRQTAQTRLVKVLISTLLGGLTACTTQTRTFLPPSAEIREQLADSSVDLIRTEQRIALDEPESGIGAGALHHAGEGARHGAAVGAAPGYVLCEAGGPYGCMYGLPLMIIMAPIGAIAGGAVGAGIGASVAHSEEEVEAASENLRAALDDADLAGDLSAYLQAAAQSRGLREFHFLGSTVPGGIAEEDEHPDLSWPVHVLRIAPYMDIQSEGDWDPDLSILISANARLVRGSDDMVTYKRNWQYRSPWRDYFDLAEHDARALRGAIDEGLRRLAEEIVTDLFLDTRPETHPVGPVAEGEVWTTMAWSATNTALHPTQTGSTEMATMEGEVATSSAPSDAVAQERMDPGSESPSEIDPVASAIEASPTASARSAQHRPPHPAENSHYYGALAITTKSVYRSGVCVDQPTAGLAEACALRECGAFCEIRARFGSGQCVAVAGTRVRERPEDIAVDTSAAAAREAAMSMCRSHPQMVGRSYWTNICQMMQPASCNLTPMQAPAVRSVGATGWSAPASATGSDSAASALAGAGMPAATGNRYGAIAVSRTSTFHSGHCTDQITAAQAESCALRVCGLHCEVQRTFGAGQCAAIAGRHGVQGVRRDNPSTRWRLGGSGVGDTPEAASTAAIADCRREHHRCSDLIRPVCNS